MINNKWILSLFALLAFACGSVNDGIIDDEVELGQTEQAVSIGNGGYGFTNATSQLRCAQPGVSGQVCFANAGTKKSNVTYCFSGFPQVDIDKLKGGFQVIDNAVNWSFTLSSTFPCDISIQNGTVSGSNTRIEQFMKAIPTGTLTSLTSPAGAAHVNGSWTSFTKLSVVVDKAKLDGFAGQAYQNNWLQVGGAIPARFIGLGSQSNTSSAAKISMTRRAMNGTLLGALSPGEICRANNTTAGNTSQINAVVQCAVD